MHLPRVLLIGEAGQVGWELKRLLVPVARLSAVDFPRIDLSNADSLRHWVRETKPEVIVNAAAYTAVDKAEVEPERAMSINGVAPGILAEEAQRTGSLLVHFSTDYVFDGSGSKPYNESDSINPLNVYGRTKAAGDHAVKSSSCAYLIFRLCWVYGLRGQNFLLTMMRLAREKEKLRVVRDQIGCPTWSRMIAQAVTHALFQVIRSDEPSSYSGVYHMAAAGATSWHRFAEEIVHAMPTTDKTCKSIEAIRTEEYPTPAKRPPYSVLACEKLERTFGARLPDWLDGLRLALDQSA